MPIPIKAGRNGRILNNGKPLTTDKHLTDLFADHAEAFIRKNASRPFFCYVPFNAVHGPLRSDDRAADSGKPEWLAKYEKRRAQAPRLLRRPQPLRRPPRTTPRPASRAEHRKATRSSSATPTTAA